MHTFLFSNRNSSHKRSNTGLSVSNKTSKSQIQPKLKIGQPNDKFEQEADHVADQVMRMENKNSSHSVVNKKQDANQIQRKCADCEKEEEENLQMKQDTSQSFNATELQTDNIKPGKNGMPLPTETRMDFESRFGHDFSKVRVHHDSESVDSAKAISAKAFTLGNNIVFGSGQFNPNNFDGKKLLAHELTHVIQQGKATSFGSNGHAASHQTQGNVVQKKDGEKKAKPKQDIKKALKAQKMVWDDLRAFFPDDIGKVAGTGFRESVGYLQTNLTEDKEGPETSSAPIIYVGNDYFNESDADKRKEKLQAEVDKINKWRIETARIENDDLKSAKVKAMLQDLSAQKKLEVIGKLKEKKGAANDKVIEYLNKVMQSTPIVPGATARDEGGFEVQFDNVKIIVLPDVYNSASVSTGAETRIKSVPDNPNWYRYPGFTWDGHGKINSMTFTPSKPDIVYSVQTFYSSGVNPRSTSGYGVGTRSTDTTSEEKTLGHHEGTHGEEFINSIKAGTAGTKWPAYTGKIGDNRQPFETAHDAWRVNIKKFQDMIKKAVDDNAQKVDCVGKTIEKYHQEKGTVSSVHCNP